MKPDVSNRYSPQTKGFGGGHRSPQSDSNLVCPDNQIVDLAYNGIKFLSPFLTGQPGTVEVRAEYQEDRGLRDMPLAAAQFRKLFPPLLILHDNHGCMLEIDPVRGRLYRLQNLF